MKCAVISTQLTHSSNIYRKHTNCTSAHKPVWDVFGGQTTHTDLYGPVLRSYHTIYIQAAGVSAVPTHTPISKIIGGDRAGGGGGAERHMGGAHRTAKEVYRDRAAGMGNKSHDKKGLSIMAEQSLQSC